MFFVIHRIVFALNGIAILLLLASYTAPYISPELYWPVAFLGLAYPVLVILNLLFIIYWIVFLKLKFLYSLVAIIIGWNFIPSYFQVGAKKSDNREGSISLISFNIKNFGAFEGKKIENPDKFFDVMTKINPDVVSFQEFKDKGTAIERQLFKTAFKQLRKYHTYNVVTDKNGRKNGDQLVIFSRFPIIDSGVVEHQPESDNFTIFADIVAYGDTIRIINTHLQSIKFEEPDYNAIKQIKHINDSTVNQYSTISRKLKIAFVKRARQSQAVRDFIEQSPYKVILSGDFNDSPASYAFRTVKGKMKDAFEEAGSGFSRTYVGRMPSFRIDYMLYDPSFIAYDYYAKSFEFSDHKMISCLLKIKLPG